MGIFRDRQREYEALPLTSEENNASMIAVTVRSTTQKKHHLFHVCFIFSVAFNFIFIAYILLRDTAWKTENPQVTKYGTKPPDRTSQTH